MGVRRSVASAGDGPPCRHLHLLLVDHHLHLRFLTSSALQMRSQASRILTEHVHIRPAILRKAAAFYATAILGRSTSSPHHEPTAAERAAGVAATADTRPLLGVARARDRQDTERRRSDHQAGGVLSDYRRVASAASGRPDLRGDRFTVVRRRAHRGARLRIRS